MNGPLPLRVLIVDDEDAARQNLRRLLEAIGGTVVAGEVADGRSAIAAIEQGDIDVVLLDIQMPELDGLAVVRAVGADRMPPVIFVTAHDEHAIAAFDLHALGYLLKPVSQSKLADQLGRVRAHDSSATDRAERVIRALEALHPGRFVTQLAIRAEGRTTFVRTREIDWIEAANVTVRIHVGKQTHELRETLTKLERMLSPNEFVRVHRSIIVRIDSVREIQPWFRGSHVLILGDGTRVTTGRTYHPAVQRLLGHR
jgi:two-component system LytT family response regulator